MLKKHKNQIYNQIESDGFNHGDFTASDANDKIYRVAVKNSKLFFEFHIQEDSFDSYKWLYSIFAPKQINSNLSNANNFSAALRTFSDWLNKQVSQFVSEREEEDLFENFNTKSEFNFENFDKDIHEYFDQSDIIFIKSKLIELSFHIQNNFKLTSDQNLKIESAIVYLTESVDKKSKFDWRGILFSTILSIITTMTLDTQKGAELWNYTVSLFQQLRLLSK